MAGFPGLGPLTSGPSPHPTGISRQRTSPAGRQNTDRRGTGGMVPTLGSQPFDRVGVQLCPPNIATATPQAFTAASRPATSTGQEVTHIPLLCGCALLRGPDPPASSRWVSRGASGRWHLHVHLSVSLAGPGPSGSTDPSRRPQGCFPPKPPVPRVQAALSFNMPAATSTRRWPPTTARLENASWRSISPTQASSGRAAPKSPLSKSGSR